MRSRRSEPLKRRRRESVQPAGRRAAVGAARRQLLESGQCLLEEPGLSRASEGGSTGVSAPGGGPWISATKNADHTIAPAVIMNAVGTLAKPRTMPAIPGPTKKPTLSIVLPTTFAAVSSVGVVASAGMIADWAGPNGTFARLTKAAST